MDQLGQAFQRDSLALTVLQAASLQHHRRAACNTELFFKQHRGESACFEWCDLVDTRGGENNNSDGFFGRAGSSIRNCFISTLDDAIKVYEDVAIENVTIEQHRNGAALQFGWARKNMTADADIRNLTIKGVAENDRYNMTPLTWEIGDHGVRNVRVEGLTLDIDGEMYDESTATWRPIGLLELKPSKATFNLRVENSVGLQDWLAGGASMGIIHTRGKIECPVDDP